MEGITNKRLSGMIGLCSSEVPSFSIKFKNEVWWMRLLGALLFFNHSFMTEYITTIGTTVYFPTKESFLRSQESSAEVLAHELIHMVEAEETGRVLFSLKYLFPQILSVLSLLSFLAFIHPAFLLNLIWLAAALPLPAYWRTQIEMNGYVMSLAVQYWRAHYMLETSFRSIASQFTGPAYYYMWPFEGDALAELKTRAQAIRTGEILADPIFKKVYKVWTLT